MELSGNSEIDALLMQAQTGDVNSMLALCQRYLDADGVTRNDAEVFKWAKLAAENGSGKGYRLMQKAYAEGHGAEQDADKAIDCELKADLIEGKLFSLRPNSPEKAEVTVENGLVFITGKVTNVGSGIDIGDCYLDQKFNLGNLKKWSKRLMDEATVTLVVVPEDLTKAYKSYASGSSIEAVILHSQKKCFISNELTPNRYLRYLLVYPLFLGWTAILAGTGFILFFIFYVLFDGGVKLSEVTGIAHVVSLYRKDKVYNRLRRAIKQHFQTSQKSLSIKFPQPLLFRMLNPVIAAYVLASMTIFTGYLFGHKIVNAASFEHSQSAGVCVAYLQSFPKDPNNLQRREMLGYIDNDYTDLEVFEKSIHEYKALLAENATKADKKDPAGSDADYMVNGRDACKKVLKMNDPVWSYSPTRLWRSFVRHSYEYSIFEYRVFAPVIYLANAARSLIYKIYPQFFNDDRLR